MVKVKTDTIEVWKAKIIEQEHINEVLEYIKAEIDEQYKWLMQTKYTIYDIDIAFSGIKSAIDKYTSGKENEQ